LYAFTDMKDNTRWK